MHTIDGIDLRTVPGNKVPGDLRLEVRGRDGQWRAVHMSLAFFLADFFTENEEHIRQYRSTWRVPGDTYFMRALGRAWRDGWQSASAWLAEQRRRKGAA